MLKIIHILSFLKKFEKDPKFKVGNHVRISKHKNILTKGYIPNWSKEGFVIKEVKILSHGHMSLVIILCKRIAKSKS